VNLVGDDRPEIAVSLNDANVYLSTPTASALALQYTHGKPVMYASE